MNILTWFKARDLTDDEYIEKLRKGQRYAKKFAWMSLLLFAGFLALALKIIADLQKHNEFVRETISRAPSAGLSVTEAFNDGLSNGLILGVGSTFFLCQALGCLVAFWMRRKESRERRLLLAYHDKLRPADRGPQFHP